MTCAVDCLVPLENVDIEKALFYHSARFGFVEPAKNVAHDCSASAKCTEIARANYDDDDRALGASAIGAAAELGLPDLLGQEDVSVDQMALSTGRQGVTVSATPRFGCTV